MGFPIEELLRSEHIQGKLPIGDDGIFNLFDKIDEVKNYPDNLLLNASRHCMRIVGAIMPDFMFMEPQILALALDCNKLTNNVLLNASLNCLGPYSKETHPLIIRELLIDIKLGLHPKKAYKKYNISYNEILVLDGILYFENFWLDEIINELTHILNDYKFIIKWYKFCQTIRTINPYKIYKYKKLMNTLKY